MRERLIAALVCLLAGAQALRAQLVEQEPKPVNANTVAYQGQHGTQATQLVTYKTVDGQALKLHIFDPAGFKPQDSRPCFLVIHGGGWVSGTAQLFYPFADYFARLGWVGISIDYRLLPKNDLSRTTFECVRDGRSAVRYVRAHAAGLGIDPNRIVVSGGSAGGHIAACIAFCQGVDEPGEDTSVSCMPDALVLFWPALDTSKDGAGNLKCGEHWQDVSPLHLVRPGMPPTLVFHGTNDRLVPYKGALAFNDAMLKAGNHCELVTQKGAGHGYMMFNLNLFNQGMQRTAEFLASLGYPVTNDGQKGVAGNIGAAK